MSLPDALHHQLIERVILTGDIAQAVPAFLRHHGCPGTAEHCAAVAAEARRVALLTGEDAEQAEHAGWLHDVSAVFPAAERIAVARQCGVDVLPEEAAFPMIIHQKLSALLAETIFGVRDVPVLSAVGCHTTLKQDAGRLDKVVFVADKLAWDQLGTAPYHDRLAVALGQSLDAAVVVYLHYLWDQRTTLRVVHPWFRAAYLQMVGDASSR